MKTVYEMNHRYDDKRMKFIYIFQCPYCNETIEEEDIIMYLLCPHCLKISKIYDELIMIMTQLKEKELQIRLQRTD